MSRTYTHPLQASHVLSTYINLQSGMLLSLSGLSPQGPCTPLLCRCPHMERGAKGRLHWSIIIHIIMHCCSLLLLISSASGGKERSGRLWVTGKLQSRHIWRHGGHVQYNACLCVKRERRRWSCFSYRLYREYARSPIKLW